jgi:hypothetical protein
MQVDGGQAGVVGGRAQVNGGQGAGRNAMVDDDGLGLMQALRQGVQIALQQEGLPANTGGLTVGLEGNGIHLAARHPLGSAGAGIACRLYRSLNGRAMAAHGLARSAATRACARMAAACTP